jgi:hypothetical protein
MRERDCGLRRRALPASKEPEHALNWRASPADSRRRRLVNEHIMDPARKLGRIVDPLPLVSGPREWDEPETVYRSPQRSARETSVDATARLRGCRATRRGAGAPGFGVDAALVDLTHPRTITSASRPGANRRQGAASSAVDRRIVCERLVRSGPNAGEAVIRLDARVMLVSVAFSTARYELDQLWLHWAQAHRRCVADRIGFRALRARCTEGRWTTRISIAICSREWCTSQTPLSGSQAFGCNCTIVTIADR